jgi:hypothetical protein
MKMFEGFLAKKAEGSKSVEKNKSVLEYLRATPKEIKLLTLGLAATLNAARAEGDSAKVSAVEASKSYNISQTENKEHLLGVTDVYNRFTMIKDGKPVFNPWATLFPFQADWTTVKEMEGTAQAEIPYLYARQFDLAQATSKEDQEKTVEYIEQKIREQLVDAITYVDPSDNSKKVYEKKHGGENLEFHDLKIKSIKITGLASPEGPEIKGPGTVAPGNVDQENIELSKKRASNMEPVVREALQKMGINDSVIADIEGAEIQFSEEEYSTLGALADEWAPKDLSDPDKMFWLTKEYNSGAFENNPEVKAKLDNLFASKRGVSITIEYENKQKEVVVVPLPNLLLLLLVVPLLKLKDRFKKDRYIFHERATRDEFKEREEQNKNQEKEQPKKSFNETYKGSLEKISKEPGKDIERMKERMFVDEVYAYMEDDRTKKLGLDYEEIMNNVVLETRRALESKKKMDILEMEVARDLLSKWQKYDRNVRDYEHLDIFQAVDYEKDAEKVGWAKVTAEGMVKMANQSIREKHPIKEILADEVNELMKQRAERKGSLQMKAGKDVPRKSLF